MKRKRQGFIEPQPGREQTVVSIDIRRAPVISEGSIQAFCSIRIDTPECLACHPVQEIIPRLSFARSRAEVAGIVGCAKLIEPRVALAGLDIIESSNRGRFFARSESDLRDDYCSSMKLRNQPGWVMRERIAV